jgi:hypothetical protein
MCDKGKAGSQFFNKTVWDNGKVTFSLKTIDQYQKVYIL